MYALYCWTMFDSVSSVAPLQIMILTPDHWMLGPQSENHLVHLYLLHGCWQYREMWMSRHCAEMQVST